MRIDAHQHFWRYDPAQYGWIGDTMQPLKRDHLPDDLRPLLDQTGVSGTIAVQARQSTAGTAWLLELADRHAWIKGVVGCAVAALSGPRWQGAAHPHGCLRSDRVATP